MLRFNRRVPRLGLVAGHLPPLVNAGDLVTSLVSRLGSGTAVAYPDKPRHDAEA